jgi:hypothetical protein
MQKKYLLIVVLVVILAVLVIYPRLGGTGQTADISQVAANPESYLGKLTLINALVATVDTDFSVLGLVDSGGCCEIPVVVPMTVEQQQGLGVPVPLYTGTLPSPGQHVEVSGNLKKHQGYFIFEADTVKLDGKVIIRKK